jgi:hypothetical protein
MMGFTVGEWIRATLGAVVFVALGWALLVFVIGAWG